MNAESRTMSVDQAARELGIGRSLAFELARNGRFPVPVLRLGHRLVVPIEPLERLLSGRAPAEDPAEPVAADGA